MSGLNVGIIGAGALGLAAGFYLTRSGNRVTVLEAAPFLGGQASTFSIGGAPIERGYHHLFKSDTHMIQLLDELGLSQELKWIESKVGIYADGRIWNFSTPYDLLTFKPLSFLNRIRLGLVVKYLQHTRSKERFESITASKWIRKYAGSQAHDLVIGPLLKGKFGKYADEISMAWLWNKFALRTTSRDRTGYREELGYPMGSFGQIFASAADHIKQAGGQVKLSTPVQEIMVSDGRAWGLKIRNEDSSDQILEFDALIATVPSYLMARLVPDLDTLYAKFLTKVDYLAAVLLILVLDRPLTPYYWINVADRNMPFLGIVEHTNFISPAVYGNNHIVYITNYLDLTSDLYSMDQESLLETYKPFLKEFNSEFDLSWIRSIHHHKINAAQPIITTNYSDKIPDFKTPIANLFLANTTQIYPEDRGTNYSVRLGKELARLISQMYC